MSYAGKENTADASIGARLQKHDNAEQGNTTGGRSRVALAAKSLNTGSRISTGSPIRYIERKRATSRSSSFESASQSALKKARTNDSADSRVNTLNELCHGDDTDEDEEQLFDVSKRLSTPIAERSTRLSRRYPYYPRLNLASIVDLDIDVPATEELSPLKDDHYEILKGFDLTSFPKLPPPRAMPNFCEQVEKCSAMSIDDFPELEIDDEEDCDVSLGPTELITPKSDSRWR